MGRTRLLVMLTVALGVLVAVPTGLDADGRPDIQVAPTATTTSSSTTSSTLPPVVETPTASPPEVTTPSTTPPVAYVQPVPMIDTALVIERPARERCMTIAAGLNGVARAPGWGSLVCLPPGIGVLGENHFAGGTPTTGGDLFIAPPDSYTDQQIARVIFHEIGHTWCITAGDLTEECADRWADAHQ